MQFEKGWWIGAITKQGCDDRVPKGQRKRIRNFENLIDEEDEDEEEDEEIPPLVESEDEGMLECPSEEEEEEEEDEFPNLE
eukprot:2937207-Karenia_brevis.AAC.1